MYIYIYIIILYSIAITDIISRLGIPQKIPIATPQAVQAPEAWPIWQEMSEAGSAGRALFKRWRFFGRTVGRLIDPCFFPTRNSFFCWAKLELNRQNILIDIIYYTLTIFHWTSYMEPPDDGHGQSQVCRRSLHNPGGIFAQSLSCLGWWFEATYDTPWLSCIIPSKDTQAPSMRFLWFGRLPKWGYPQIIHLYRWIFHLHSKPSIFGYPWFRKPPLDNHLGRWCSTTSDVPPSLNLHMFPSLSFRHCFEMIMFLHRFFRSSNAKELDESWWLAGYIVIFVVRKSCLLASLAGEIR